MKATLSSNRLSLLDPLHITLDFPPGNQPDLDRLRSSLAKEFIILSEKIEPGQIEWTVASQTPGRKIVNLGAEPQTVEIFLPKIDHYQGELAPLHTFSTKPQIPISEENILLEVPDFHAEKIAAKTFPIGLLALIFTLAAFLYYFRDKLKPRKKEPAEIANRSLEKIQSLPEEEYYEKLSSVVRQFIEDKHHFKAPAKTSQECLEKLVLTKEQKELLQSFFNAADPVNYASHLPTSEERQRATLLAKRFINDE